MQVDKGFNTLYLLLQFGGPDGELGAATRYLSQRYGAPSPQVKAILTDIGSEVSKWYSYIHKNN